MPARKPSLKETPKKRKATPHDAWMTLKGGSAKRSAVLDLSNGRAEIKVHEPHPINGKPSVAFSKDVRKITRCRLVWRDESIVGLEFMVPV
ncbi:PilZ domain-containing protein [Bradyrhizobium prioriisuperbiae]|uniref:PilZ domain-containing protein n=1 Tax=Bradyrhizobium prioriisuperbiae TaxID=2854389 RepID=UPI0028EAAA59|nr:PilZ domain-containing protein [Bradyrhizobium prioritasuperba]